MRECNDEIVIRFEPFQVMLDQLHQEGQLDRHVSIAWCDLPDILYSAVSREFVGLSFALTSASVEFVASFVTRVADTRVRYVPVGMEPPDRYIGFGTRDRLEICWSNALEIACEMTSLDNGAWLYRRLSDKVNEEVPYGYQLVSLNEILPSHGMTLNSGQLGV